MQAKFQTRSLLLSLAATLAACGQVLSRDTPLPPTLTPTIVLERPAVATQTPSPTRSQISVPTDPPPSPEPTPTPIVYVVEPGDTLLGIAAQFDVSADAVQIANPGLRPELLQIGQRITIPAGERESQSGQLLPTPIPLPLQVAGFALYETPTGGLLGLGEVINGTEFSAENVRLSVSIVDDDGEIVATSDAWTACDLIPPAKSAPFGVLFLDLPTGPLTSQISLISGVHAARVESRYADIRLTQQQGGMAGAVYRVTGTVANLGERPTPEVTLVVTLYDRDDRVTGFRETVLAGPLLSGGTAEFDVQLSTAGAGAHHHGICAEGRSTDQTD